MVLEIVIIYTVALIALTLSYVNADRRKMEDNYFFYQWNQRSNSAKKVFEDSILTGLFSYLIYYLFLLTDIFTNIIRSYFEKLDNEGKPKGYTNKVDIAILIYFSIVLFFTNLPDDYSASLLISTFFIWRLLLLFIAYFQMTFESFLGEGAPDVVQSQARVFVLWIFSSIEITLIYMWDIENNNNSFHELYIDFISLRIDSSTKKIPLLFYQILSFIIITTFIRNIKNLREAKVKQVDTCSIEKKVN